MDELVIKLIKHCKVERNNLRKRKKITKKGRISIAYQLEYYSENAMQIINFLYSNLEDNDLYLKRKFLKAKKARKFYEEQQILKRYGRSWIRNEEKYGESMNKLLVSYLSRDNLIPREISNELGVSLSTVYRWLDKSGVRKMERRGSEEWARRVIESRKLIRKNGQRRKFKKT